MALRTRLRARLAWPLGLLALGACNGQILVFQRSDGGASGGADGGVISFSAPTGAVVQAATVDKVDILFDIDNSASMGDKQEYLKAAIPDLVNRLINPNCVDNSGLTQGASVTGDCTAYPNTRAEFRAVHDMHLGIISSSLGGRGGNVCNPMATAPTPFQSVQAHNDDDALLLNRSLMFSPPLPASPTSVQEGVVADAATNPFLYWYPAAPNVGKTPGAGQQITSGSNLVNDFAEMVGGTGVFGCGIESQLESWYRFLIQPDPYGSISANGGKASWQGVDQQILKERHDFLRPDSLVVIIVLSDENDSEIDVRSVGGQGVNWMSTDFTPPKGTTRVRVAADLRRLPVVRAGEKRDVRSELHGRGRGRRAVHGGERLGLRHQPPPRPHEGQVRRGRPVPDRALRDRADVDDRARPQRRVPARWAGLVRRDG